MKRSDQFFVSVFIAAALFILPGCVVWDIEEGIAESNDRLVEIDDGLGDINTNLVSMEDRLAMMNEELGRLQVQLDETNKHLDSLRATIKNIDNTIPFLSLSSEEEEEQQENGDAPEPRDEQ